MHCSSFFRASLCLALAATCLLFTTSLASEGKGKEKEQDRMELESEGSEWYNRMPPLVSGDEEGEGHDWTEPQYHDVPQTIPHQAEVEDHPAAPQTPDFTQLPPKGALAALMQGLIKKSAAGLMHSYVGKSILRATAEAKAMKEEQGSKQTISLREAFPKKVAIEPLAVQYEEQGPDQATSPARTFIEKLVNEIGAEWIKGKMSKQNGFSGMGFLGKLISEAYAARNEEQGSERMISLEEALLGKPINDIFTELDEMKNEEAADACRCALVADERLRPAFWSCYATTIADGDINVPGPLGGAVKRLENILEITARMGLLKVMKAIISGSEDAQPGFSLRINGSQLLALATKYEHANVVKFMLEKKWDEAELRRRINLVVRHDFAIRGMGRLNFQDEAVKFPPEELEIPGLYGIIEFPGYPGEAPRPAAMSEVSDFVKLLLKKKGDDDHDMHGYQNIDPAAINSYAL